MWLDRNQPAREFLEAVQTPEARLHFSQFGEDCLVWHYFHERWDGFYVDVGAHDPFRYSNTHLLHRYRRWRGVNIDADPRAIERFSTARPNDFNVHLGIAASAGRRQLALFDDGAVNTFDPEIAVRQAVHFGTATEADIEVLPLSAALDRFVPAGVAIDYMNIDCEWLDEEVVRSNDWTRYRPDVVSVELHDLHLEEPLAHGCVRFLKEQGYAIASHYFRTAVFELRR